MTDRPTDKYSMKLEGVQDAHDRMAIQHSPCGLTLSDEHGDVTLLSVYAEQGQRTRIGLTPRWMKRPRPAAMLTASELRQHIAACVAALAVMEGEGC